MIFLASTYFTIALLVSSCSSAMEIVSIAASDSHKPTPSWYDLPLDVQKYIVLLVGDETPEHDNTLRQINKHIHSLISSIVERRKQGLIDSLLEQPKTNFRFNFNIISFKKAYTPSRGYEWSEIDFNKPTIDQGSKKQIVLNNVHWNKHSTACCFVARFCNHGYQNFRGLALTIYSAKGIHSTQSLERLPMLSKPFFDSSGTACLLWLDHVTNQKSKFNVCEFRINEAGREEEASIQLIIGDLCTGFVRMDSMRLRRLPLFLKACSQGKNISLSPYLDNFLKTCPINKTNLSRAIQEKLITEDHSHKGYHKKRSSPCATCDAQDQRLQDNREEEAIFYYLGGNFERAYAWLQNPSQVLEHDVRPWPLGYKKIIENRRNPLASYNQLDLDSALKQCTLENLQPLHNFVRTTKMTQYAPYPASFVQPLRIQEYLDPSKNQTKLLRISYANAIMHNYTTGPMAIAVDETCTYACLSSDYAQFAYVLKNKQNKTQHIAWYKTLHDDSPPEQNYVYPANEELFKKIDDIGENRISRLSFDSNSLQTDESTGLTIYMKPKTLLDFIYMPIHYYPGNTSILTDAEQQKSYIATRRLNASLFHPMTWLICAYRSMVHTKKLLYDLQG